MDHLTPHNTKTPIRVPYYQQRPDDDGHITPVGGYAYIFEAIVKYHADELVVAEREYVWRDHVALWFEQCLRGRVYNLCYALLDKIYFGLLRSILGPEVADVDFTKRDNDGVTYLTTAALGRCLFEWKSRVEGSDMQAKKALKCQYTAILEQTRHVLRHLAWFRDVTSTCDAEWIESRFWLID